jgi:hypothetical protein
VSPEVTSLPAKVITIEKRGDQYQVIAQIATKYRGSFNPNSDSRNLPFGPKPVIRSTSSESRFNTLAFGEIKPYIGSLKDGRLDFVYYRDPGLGEGDPFPLWTLH